MQITHSFEDRVLFSQVVRELGQRLGGGDTDADRQARPLTDPFSHLLAHSHRTTVQMGHRFDAQEAFINAVDLDVRREVAQDGRYTIAHVTVQRVV